MNLIKTAVATAAVLAAGLGVAAPASADSQTHDDPKGDVTKVDIDQRGAKPGIDVVHLKNTYQGKKLTMSLTTANLQAKGYAAEWFITTDDDTYLLVLNHFKRRPTVGFDSFGAPLRVRPLARGDETQCARAKAAAKGDAVVATVPRSCLGGADVVRIAAFTLARTKSDPKIDDARQKGFDPNGPGLSFGPELQHS